MRGRRRGRRDEGEGEGEGEGEAQHEHITLKKFTAKTTFDPDQNY